jgi:phage terminase small subunit
MPAKDGLTDKQRRFVEEYMVDFNATQAAIRAGYSKRTAGRIGDQNVKKLVIKEAIQAQMNALSEKTGITAERVREELGRLAFSNMDDYAEWGPGGVTLTDSSQLSEDAARAVAEVSQTITKEGGSIRFKLHDKKGALDSLAKHFGMFTEKVEHSGTVEVKVNEVKWTQRAEAEDET